MIGEKIAAMLIENKEGFIIPAEKVANIGVNNTLDHALLVLTNAGYNVIPVLDDESKVKGLLSLPNIIRAATGIEAFDFNKLSDITVADIMQTDIPKLGDQFELETALHLLVRHSFICVTDTENILKGIVTRSELLKGTNRVAHLFESVYEVTEKEMVETDVEDGQIQFKQIKTNKN